MKTFYRVNVNWSRVSFSLSTTILPSQYQLQDPLKHPKIFTKYVKLSTKSKLATKFHLQPPSKNPRIFSKNKWIHPSGNKVSIVSSFNHHFPNEKSFLRSTKKALNILKDNASSKSCPSFLLSTSDDNVARVLGTALICAHRSAVFQME